MDLRFQSNNFLPLLGPSHGPAPVTTDLRIRQQNEHILIPFFLHYFLLVYLSPSSPAFPALVGFVDVTARMRTLPLIDSLLPSFFVVYVLRSLLCSSFAIGDSLSVPRLALSIRR